MDRLPKKPLVPQFIRFEKQSKLSNSAEISQNSWFYNGNPLAKSDRKQNDI